MTDDAAKPESTAPAQVPPSTAPAPTETLEATPVLHTPAGLPSDAPAPAQLPPVEEPTLKPSVYEAPSHSSEPLAAPVAQAAGSRGASKGLAVLLALICVVVLFAAGYVFWLSREAAGQLTARLDGLDQRMSALEQRPVPAPVNLGPLNQRLTALEQKPPPQAQLDAAGHAEIASVAGRVDQLLARQDQLGQREQADFAKLNDQLTAQDARITQQDAKIASAAQAGSAAGGQVNALVARETRLAALQAASGALAAGRPLGAIPGAPPALAQFADKPPPTEAALRLSFDDAAHAAHEAGMPAKTDTPFMSRIWARMQSSVTIRQGDHVVVGDAASDILAHAQSQLEAGDLAGAVATLGELTGPAAASMAPWRQRAQSLLDARAALLTLARG